MIAVAEKIDGLVEPLRKVSSCAISPVVDLGIRLYMANIFFKSGMLKFKNYLNDDWGSTVFLFEEIHPVPFVSPQFAAASGTAGELILPVLLALGLFGRLGALGLLFMTIVIQYGVPADYGLQNDMHYYWMLLLAVIAFKGPGKLSVDALIQKFALKKGSCCK